MLQVSLDTGHEERPRGKVCAVTDFSVSGFSFLWPCHLACAITVPQIGIESAPSAVQPWSLNHWTTEKDLSIDFSRILSADYM